MINNDLQRLVEIAHKKEKLVIGLMSGTSLDGLDIALCQIIGHGMNTQLQVLQFASIPYEPEFRNEIQSIFSVRMVDLEKLCLLHAEIANLHARYINSCLQKWKIDASEVDLIASHGQTIYHAPKHLHGLPGYGNASLQIGDGDHIAVATGIITISDFRQKHLAMGAEGAPLAVYGDQFLFGKTGERRVLLNIGGIANYTFLPGNDEKAILCTDLGPGNTMMDAFMRMHYPGQYYDNNAELAKAGNVNEDLLLDLQSDKFFMAPYPKTTGPELFSLQYLQSAQKKTGTEDISPTDCMATLNKFTANMIVKGIREGINDTSNLTIICSGGGVHNPVLMQNLENEMKECRFQHATELGIDPDAKEAVLFALLANECISGNAEFIKEGIPGIPATAMGKISFPH